MSESYVWKYFEKKSLDTAVCSMCAKIISCKGKSTSGLIRHLKGVHKLTEEKDECTDEPSEKVQKVQTTIPQFSKNHQIKTLSTIVSELAAVDGLSIRTVTKSSFIRESLRQRGLSLPKTERDVQLLIMEKFTEVKSEMKISIEEQLKNKFRFSLIMDEWTSIKNRRYLNICLYGKENTMFNLGLVYIPGRSGAIEIRSLMEARLKEYGISFENHIVSTTTDGPNVMKKFVRESPVDGIFCLSHALHLSVVDVLYKKTFIENENTGTEESDGENFDDDFENEHQGNILEINTNYKLVLEQTRRIVKVFKKSPTKNCVLQKYVMAEHNKEISLELDVVTRWNSMVPMIEKILLLKNSIKKSLIDLEMGELWVEVNVSVLENILKVLKPIKLATEALCRRDVNILTAEAIIGTLCLQISKINTLLARTMHDSLKNRIAERRDSKLYTLVKYLNNPNVFDETCNLFPNASKQTIVLYAEQIYKRLFGEDEIEEFQGSDDSNIAEEQTFEAILNAAINNVNDKSKINIKTPLNSIRKDLRFFDSSGKKTENIEKLFQALLTIKPSSVESERVFSLAGQCVTKIRNRLSDETINALSVLKRHLN